MFRVPPGYQSVGVERDRKYFDLALEAIPKLSKLAVKAV